MSMCSTLAYILHSEFDRAGFATDMLRHVAGHGNIALYIYMTEHYIGDFTTFSWNVRTAMKASQDPRKPIATNFGTK